MGNDALNRKELFFSINFGEEFMYQWGKSHVPCACFLFKQSPTVGLFIVIKKILDTEVTSWSEIPMSYFCSHFFHLRAISVGG